MTENNIILNMNVRAKDNDENEIVQTGKMKCETCQRNRRQNLAKAFCVQCQEFMCRKCSGYHFRSTQTRHHRTIEDNEMPLLKASTSVAELCTVHNGEICHFYCESHNTLICSVCNACIHTKCKNIRPITELSHGVAMSERFLTTRAEIKRMLESFRNLKTKLVSRLHKTHNNHPKTAAKIHTTSLDNSEQIQNLINTEEVRMQKDIDEVRGLIYICDAEIYKAETVKTNFGILIETKQHVQLYIALKAAEDLLKQMIPVHKEIVGKTEKNTYVTLSIEEPVPVVTDRSRSRSLVIHPVTVCSAYCSIICYMLIPLYFIIFCFLALKQLLN